MGFVDLLTIFHLFASGLLTLLFPFYVVYFIIFRKKAKRIGLRNCPSSFTLKFYFFIIFFYSIYFFSSKYMRYITTSRESEAKTNLASIATAQISYYDEQEIWAGENNDPVIFTTVGWSPTGNTRYAYYCGKDVVTPTSDQYPFNYPLPDEKWPFSIRPKQSPVGFTCIAVGNIDGDDFLDIWKIDQNKSPQQLYSDRFDEALVNIAGIEPNPKRLKWKQIKYDFKMGLLSSKGFAFLTFFGGVPLLIILIIRDEKRYRAALGKST